MTAASNAVAVRPQEAQITEIPRNDPGAVMEAVVAKGDLSKLEPGERARYYVAVCQSVGLNPLTRPFLYIDFGANAGGLQMYPTKGAADQLRGIHKVQTRIVEQRVEQGIFLVTVEARHPDGRIETDIGAVPIKGLEGLFLANAMKKAITQGKRRATLAMLGLSLIDDDEVKAIKGARFVEVDPASGEIGTILEVPTESAVEDAPAPIGNAARADAVKAINAAVRAAFGQIDNAKDVRDEIVCRRYGLREFRQATADQLRDAADAVGSWSKEWAPKALRWLELVEGAATESMATDVAILLEENGVDDAFVGAALSDALARLEIAATDAVVDAAMAS